MDTLSTIDDCLTDNYTYLLKANKVNPIYTDLDAVTVKELFFKYSYTRKIDLQQKVQKIWKHNTLSYKTEKGFKSDKLYNLFKSYYGFITNPSTMVQQDITKYNSYDKGEIVAEKYDLHYDCNDNTDIIDINIVILRNALNRYCEKYGKNKPCSFSIKKQQFINILNDLNDL